MGKNPSIPFGQRPPKDDTGSSDSSQRKAPRRASIKQIIFKDFMRTASYLTAVSLKLKKGLVTAMQDQKTLNIPADPATRHELIHFQENPNAAEEITAGVVQMRNESEGVKVAERDILLLERKDLIDAEPLVGEKSRANCHSTIKQATIGQCSPTRDMGHGRNRDEGEAIKYIVEHVTRELDFTELFVDCNHLVGIQSRAQHVIQLLNHQKSKAVLLLGIWGAGGIGKTTIAKAICNQIGREFEEWKFLPNIRETWEKDSSQVSLQELLLSAVNKTPAIKIHSIESGKVIINDTLHRKRLLLVLDDVDKLEQLDALCGSREWFGPGSRIIITTRDKQLLSMFGVDHVYEVKELDYSESVKLLSLIAFNKATPEEDFAVFVRDVAAYCQGLPLAIKCLGSYLCGRTVDVWKVTLDKLGKFPYEPVQEKLKISYDNLTGKEKEMFLDIACFFNGMDRNDVIHTLNAAGHSAEIGISVLEMKSLVTVDNKNKLRMHPLLRDMGRDIVREKSKIETQPMIYDVFLSFRGKDTRPTFASHLHTSLENAGIYVFKDDSALSRGEGISVSVLKAIQKSRISVIVLSQNYADSRWCLLELENIMECYKTKGQVVVPVFYGVDPSEVHNQTGLFGQAFEDLIKRISVEEDKVWSWRTALREVGGFSGIIVINSRNETKNIKNVVERVARLVLEKANSSVEEHLVGVESHVQYVTHLLNNQQLDDVLQLGIWGMGGIGKTTIAKTIYNQIGCKFDGSSFLQNIREDWQQKGPVYLHEQILSDIYSTDIERPSNEPRKKIFKDDLRHKRVLLVLDNVNKFEQLEALCGSRKWFGPRSMIIITTRDKDLLDKHKVDHLRIMKEMDENESLELFSWHAFKQATPREDFAELSRKVVSYSGGLPLALKVLGTELCGKGITEWERELNERKRTPHPEIQKVLKRSYDDLKDDEEKDIFLDIASFFSGIPLDDVKQALQGFGTSAETKMIVLVNQSLLTVDEENIVRMHTLLLEMGKEIFREKLQVETGPRIYDVFLSFRGKDTRPTFTSHLYNYLENEGIYVFKDDVAIQRGDRISTSLLQAIGRSRISVIVLSRNYANSRWCMIELENIMKCHRTISQVVVPVFYGVEPHDVRHQAGTFGEAFKDLLKKISIEEDTKQSWRTALSEIGGFSGQVIINSRYFNFCFFFVCVITF